MPTTDIHAKFRSSTGEKLLDASLVEETSDAKVLKAAERASIADLSNRVKSGGRISRNLFEFLARDGEMFSFFDAEGILHALLQAASVIVDKDRQFVSAAQKADLADVSQRVRTRGRVSDNLLEFLAKNGELFGRADKAGVFDIIQNGLKLPDGTKIYSFKRVDPENAILLTYATGEKMGTLGGDTVLRAEVAAARGSRSNLDQRMSVSLDSYGFAKVADQGLDNLRRTRRRVAILRAFAGSTGYSTYAALNATSPVDGTRAWVDGDTGTHSSIPNSGLYVRRGGSWFRVGPIEQLVYASIGDSWQKARDYYGAEWYAQLKAALGDAGQGWCGYSWVTSNTLGNINGCIDAAVQVTVGASWTPSYTTSTGPDLGCQSDAAGTDMISTTGIAAGQSIVLFYEPVAGASVEYRWNAGSWTTVALGSGTSVALTTDPAGGQLDIRRVAGAPRLCGHDARKLGPGVRYHKLGASGTAASQWAAVNAAAQQASWAALGINHADIQFGVNDQNAGQLASLVSTSVNTLITRLKAAAVAAIAVYSPPELNRPLLTNTMASYAAAFRQVCNTANVAFHDLQADYGLAVADYTDLIDPDPVASPHPRISNGGGMPILAAKRRIILGDN